MQSAQIKSFSPNQMLAILAFVAAGIAFSPLFFAGALLVAGLAVAKWNKPLGYGLSVLGLVCFLLMLGYGIGKDMAHRDNTRSSAMSSLLGHDDSFEPTHPDLPDMLEALLSSATEA